MVGRWHQDIKPNFELRHAIGETVLNTSYLLRPVNTTGVFVRLRTVPSTPSSLETVDWLMSPKKGKSILWVFPFRYVKIKNELYVSSEKKKKFDFLYLRSLVTSFNFLFSSRESFFPFQCEYLTSVDLFDNKGEIHLHKITLSRLMSTVKSPPDLMTDKIYLSPKF